MKDIETSVINATIELIIDKGINELKTAKIAKCAGTSETVIYRHFENKQDIINQTVSFLIQEQLNKLEIVKQQQISALAKLDELLTIYLNFNEGNKGLSRLVFSDQFHMGDMQLKQMAKNGLEKYEFSIMEILQDGIEEGVFRADLDLKTAAQSYIATIYFVMNKWSLAECSWSLLNEKERIVQYWIKLWSNSSIK
jgi:TetR/AcrR family fatty acid metabolism transcriptional regulator